MTRRNWKPTSPGGDPDEDTDGVREADADEGFSEIEEELADFLNEALEEPVGRRRARGEPLWVGFDGEWVFDEVAQRNNILSISSSCPRSRRSAATRTSRNALRRSAGSSTPGI
jgi:hypothetical protein